MNLPNWAWWILGGAALYGIYEWLSAECQLPTSSVYGGTICTTLFPAAASSAVTTSAVSSPATPTAPLSTAATLAGYGIPADAVPAAGSALPNCSLAQPAQSGFNPTPGLPFWSPSEAQYYCGPANLWQQMGGVSPDAGVVMQSATTGTSGLSVNRIHRNLIHRRAA